MIPEALQKQIDGHLNYYDLTKKEDRLAKRDRELDIEWGYNFASAQLKDKEKMVVELDRLIGVASGQLKEKENEIEELKVSNGLLNDALASSESQRKHWADMCIKKQAEIERLKGLIEEEWRKKISIEYSLNEAKTEQWWNNFKKQNKL